jgi:superfamily II DNA or RNA helicase
MKKAVLSNRIYINFDETLYKKLKEELTYLIPSKIMSDPPIKICLLNVIGHKFLSFPIGRIDLIPSDYELVDNRICNPVEFPEFMYKLRDSQQWIYDDIDDNALINADVSWGKTFSGIAIATKLQQKTLVITHTVALRDQWLTEIKKTIGIKAGTIGSGIFTYKTVPIVVSNVQTLRKHIPKLRDEFGLVILDEVHHCPAKIFSECIDGLRARYKLGLSATLKRKDNMHVVITDYFGKKIYRPAPENQMEPKVVMLQTDIPFSSNNMIPWANRINELVERPEYIDLVTSIANRYADLGHLVLAVSDRTEFLDRCHMRAFDRSVLITGPMKDRNERHNLILNRERDILFGTLSIYKEGISLNPLSCLILGTPINNDPLLQQLIGRIQREYPDKLQPVIVDIVLKGTTAKKQAYNRAAYYIRRGYKVKHIDLT